MQDEHTEPDAPKVGRAYAFRQGSETRGGELDQYGMENTLAFGFPRAMWLLAVNRLKYAGKWELHVENHRTGQSTMQLVSRAELEKVYAELAKEYFADDPAPTLEIRGVI